VLAELDGELRDMNRPLKRAGPFELVMRDDPEALETIRHDTAHVLAEAVQELFPGTQVTIGPAIEDGFYYDFARDEPFSTDDFEKIEAKMREIVDRDAPIVREVWDRDAAIAHFKDHRRDLQGRDHRDLPGRRDDHALSPGRLGRPVPRAAPAVDQACRQGLQADQAGRRLLARRPRNAQLQRIYGTAWATRRSSTPTCCARGGREARPPQARPQMDLFHMQEEGRAWSSGTPRAGIYRDAGGLYAPPAGPAGYVEVKTPQVLDRTFWEKSGHWDKYRANMFVCETVEGETLASSR
jgi:threonyl-tRNA synthetase